MFRRPTRRQHRQRLQSGVGVMGDAAFDRICDRGMVGDKDGVDLGLFGARGQLPVVVEPEDLP